MCDDYKNNSANNNNFAARKFDARINNLVSRIKSHLSNLISFAARKFDALIINVAARARANQVSSQQFDHICCVQI